MIPQGISGLIPAAGFSSRMGAFKPLLLLGQNTMIERVINLFRTQGITDVLVVLGYEAPRLITLVESLGARWVMNDNYQEDMLSSIKIGVRHLHHDSQAFFLLPVDFPLIRPETLKSLMAAFHTSRMDVYQPFYQKKRGHPPLISSALIDDLINYKEPGGMRSFLSGYENSSLMMECEDPGILINLNNWEDYEKACDIVKAI
jgi:molybdenum cofactor cytidylyltransferase